MILLSNVASAIPLQPLPRAVKYLTRGDRKFRLKLAGICEVKRLAR